MPPELVSYQVAEAMFLLVRSPDLILYPQKPGHDTILAYSLFVRHGFRPWGP